MVFTDKVANDGAGLSGELFRGGLPLPGSKLSGLSLLASGKMTSARSPKANLRVEASTEDDGAKRNRGLGSLVTAEPPHQPSFRLLSRGKKN